MEWMPLIGSVAAGPLIAIVIELMKNLGLPAKYAVWANVVFSGVWCSTVVAKDMFPQYAPQIIAVVEFLWAMLSASGFYDEAIKRLKGTKGL